MKKLSFHITALLLILLLAVNYIGCGGSKSLSILTPQQLFEEGKVKYDEKKYIKALEYFQTIVYNYPGETLVDTAQYYLGLTYFGNGEYEVAQVEFNRLVSNYPSSVYFENALFMKAVCFFEGTPDHYGLDQSDLKIAIKRFEDFIIDYPESEMVPDAQNYLNIAQTRMARKIYESGIVYVRLGSYKAAEMYFQKVIDEYTDTEFAADATFGLAEAKYKQKLYEEAKTKFSDFLIVFPGHKMAEKAKKLHEASSFKSAESAFDKGDMTAAKESFESFKTDFPNSKKVSKADKFLNIINETKVVEEKKDDGNS